MDKYQLGQTRLTNYNGLRPFWQGLWSNHVTSNRVIFSGRLFNSEDWSTGFSFAARTGEELTDYADLERWAIAIGQLNGGKIFPPALQKLLTTSASITSVRTEARSSNGKLMQAGEYSPPAPIVGQGTATKTFQTALVLSIRTGRPGRSFRGRSFLPALGAVTSSITGRLTDPSPSGIASGGVLLLSQIAGAAGGGFSLVPVVESRTLERITIATAVDVGDVLDVMRRRRDKLTEARTTEVIIPAS